MSRSKVHQDPVAVTCGGDVLVNAASFDGVTVLEEVLERARRERGAVFVGFVVTPDDMPLVFDRVQDACAEGAAFVVGRRQRRRRGP